MPSHHPHKDSLREEKKGFTLLLFCNWVFAFVRPGCTHLPDLLAHDGEHPEVQHILRDGWTRGWWGLKVHQQHVGKQQEEEEVHQDVAQK